MATSKGEYASRLLKDSRRRKGSRAGPTAIVFIGVLLKDASAALSCAARRTDFVRYQNSMAMEFGKVVNSQVAAD